MNKEQYLKRAKKLDNKVRRNNDKYVEKTIKRIVKRASKKMKNPQYSESLFSGYAFSKALIEIHEQLSKKFPFFEIRVEHASQDVISIRWHLKEE